MPMNMNRRQLLQSTACGFGSLALAGLHSANVAAAGGELQRTHHAPRAKRVIFIFMQGGPSQVDTFEHKPQLDKYDGKSLDFRNARQMRVQKERLMKSPWKFTPHGERGHLVSELFPHMAKHVDDYCLIHSMHTEGVAHGPATLFLHTGATNLVRPSVGSWVTYGLGSENENLPGFITLNPPPTKGGPRNYSNAFLPAKYQGTAIGRAGIPVKNSRIEHLRNPSFNPNQQAEQLALLGRLNASQASDSQSDQLDAVIDSYELAFRMQAEAPEVMDLSGESAETLASYGIGQSATDDFGRQCLLARRMAEAGVRYVQVNYADLGATPRWDQHSNIQRHEKHAKATDQPVAALLADLKQRGLLEDTLVWWGGEFGRTPYTQGRDGRDHNPNGFTVWLAGGGVKPGMSYGATDEFGAEAVENKVHMHDLHATILHQLGLKHKQLTFQHAGRDFRLTDVAGRVIHDILA